MSSPIITEYSISADYPISEPIRIAHVSDLHERRADDILELLRQSAPDMIVVTGDTFERYDNRPQYDFEHRPVKRLIVSTIHYTNHLLTCFVPDDKKPHTKYAKDFLHEAVKIAPVYLSFGNHEQKLRDEDYRFLIREGITLLDNCDTCVNIKGLRMQIGGMSSWEYEDFLADFKAKKGFKLLLCHHPERFEPFIMDSDIDLTLSGHTHGGQFRIGNRGRGFFVPGQGLFGCLAHGCFYGGRLIVSSGCSNTVVCPRVCNPRELVLVTLTKGD